MSSFLIKYWKTRFKLIDDESVFKVFLIMAAFIFIACIGGIEFLCAKDKNIIGFLIIISLCVQYNRNSIIMNISYSRANTFKVSGKKLFLNFCIFQILKENVIVLPAIFVSITVSFVMFFWDFVTSLLILIVILLEILSYVVSYKIEKNKINNKKITFKRMNFNKVGVAYNNITYFLRQPIGAYFEMLTEMTVVIAMVGYGIPISIVNYFLIILLVLDIELDQDKSMNEYNKSYGKYTIKELSGVSALQKYLGSNEFRFFLKYLIIELSVAFSGKIIIFGFILLMIAVSYKYFCSSLYIYRKRCLIKNTIFRTVMFYTVLVSIAPFLFEKEMYKIFANYKTVYGVAFMIIISMILLATPIEKIINVVGKSVDEE